MKNSPLISTSLTDFLQMAFTIFAILRVSLITLMKDKSKGEICHIESKIIIYWKLILFLIAKVRDLHFE